MTLLEEHPSCQACQMARQVGRPGCSVHYPFEGPLEALEALEAAARAFDEEP